MGISHSRNLHLGILNLVEKQPLPNDQWGTSLALHNPWPRVFHASRQGKALPRGVFWQYLDAVWGSWDRLRPLQSQFQEVVTHLLIICTCFSLFLDNIQVVHINSNNCYSIVPSLHVFRAYAVLRGPCFPETPHWTIRVAGGQYFFTSRKFKIPLTRTLECVRFVWIYSLWSQLWNQLSLFSGSLWWERWECWIYAASFDDFWLPKLQRSGKWIMIPHSSFIDYISEHI